MNGIETAFSSLLLKNMALASGERVAVFSDTSRSDEKPAAADRTGGFHEDCLLYSPTVTGTMHAGSSFLILDNGRLQV